LEIAPDSRAFLVEMLTGLRDGLAEEMRTGGRAGPDPARATRDLAVYDVLLAGLSGRDPFPDDESVRHHVAELLRITDEENGYEQAALEHRAFTELAASLGAT
jgi:hypothetical protein